MESLKCNRINCYFYLFSLSKCPFCSLRSRKCAYPSGRFIKLDKIKHVYRHSLFSYIINELDNVSSIVCFLFLSITEVVNSCVSFLMITQVALSHSASLANEFSYLTTLLITVPACDLLLKSLVREIQIDLSSAVILLNSSVCICLCFRAEVGTIFALSWLITWFGHVLSESKHTLRLYDFFLSSHPLMPIYLAATVRTCRRQQGVKQGISSSLTHHPETHTHSYLLSDQLQFTLRCSNL